MALARHVNLRSSQHRLARQADEELCDRGYERGDGVCCRREHGVDAEGGAEDEWGRGGKEGGQGVVEEGDGRDAHGTGVGAGGAEGGDDGAWRMGEWGEHQSVGFGSWLVCVRGMGLGAMVFVCLTSCGRYPAARVGLRPRLRLLLQSRERTLVSCSPSH